jgi:hypothetical protein
MIFSKGWAGDDHITERYHRKLLLLGVQAWATN